MMEPMDDDDYLEKRKQQLGFLPQKELAYNRFLPYADVLDDESVAMLAEIKSNIARTILLRELRPGHSTWISRLGRYIHLYGMKFSKEDHIVFIKLLYECLTIPDLDLSLISKYAQILLVLLKKQSLLTPDELTLDWRPLYKIVKDNLDSSSTQLGLTRFYTTLPTTLHFLIHAAKPYFPLTATQEILDEFMPYVYPLSDSNLDFSGVEWFLPVTLPPEKAHFGYKLWLEDIMQLWAACNHVPGWQSEVLRLVSILARYNIGYIDWEPYIPVMFTRFLTFFSLPVFYKKPRVKKLPKIDFTHTCGWIVSTLGGGSSCQQYLDKFLKSIETYFHQANFGTWSLKLREFLYKLTLLFVKRLHAERDKKPTWLTPVPDSHKLTDDDVDRFVESLRPVAMQALCSYSIDVIGALQNLANLRPKLICPELIERFYMNVDSLTEPHKLTSLMQCIVGVSLPIANGLDNGYTEGPLHILPMLMAALPGIDPNDTRKCIVTFQFIQMFVSVIPLIDCSTAAETWTDLTDEEEQICAMTAGFEDFVCQFFDRIFALIENSALEATRMDKNKDERRNRVDILSERALVSVCYAVLTQTSPQIFQAALKKLTPFVTDRIMETSVGGRTVAAMCGTFARTHPDETFKALLPRLIEKIITITESEDVCKDFDVDDELHYNLHVLSAILECRTEGLLSYFDQLIAVFDRCLFLASRDGYTIAITALNNLFTSLTSTSVKQHETLNADYLYKEHKKLPIREWGALHKLRDVEIAWHLPNEQDVAAAQSLLNRYLPPVLEKLEKHMSGQRVLSKTELENSLLIISAVFGAEALLPLWKEDPIVLIESCIPVSQLKLTLGTKYEITMPDGSNVRYSVAHFLNRLQDHMLKTSEDDVSSFLALIKILQRILLNKMSGRDFENHYNGHLTLKKTLVNELKGSKYRPRLIHMCRILLQHVAREERIGACLTPTHQMLMIALFKLSCSHYSKVRSRAQLYLTKGIDFFPFSYRVIIPGLVENFKADPTTAHDTIKGSLYTVLGGKPIPIIARDAWTIMLTLWPAVVRCRLSEKLSIIHLLESLKEVVNKLTQTVNIITEVPDSCITTAITLYEHYPKPSQPQPTEIDVENGKKAQAAKNEENMKNYSALLDLLCDAVEDKSLHWRQNSLALNLIRNLVHPKIPYPARVVRLLLDSLISDSLQTRKTAVTGVLHCLKQQKREHKKVDVDLQKLCPEPLPEKFAPGCRPDNMWLQYNFEKRPLSADAWDEFRYRHEAGYGYLGCHRILKFYAPSHEQPNLDRTIEELSNEEKEVVLWFSNTNNVDKLMEFLSMEEKKGKDKYNPIRSGLFKGLFRNHGDSLLHVFKPHLQQLVVRKEENYQRCAAEFITGLIRGCKHWPFEKVEALWSFLVPVIQTAVAHITEETVFDWGVCFATSSLNRDPNRNHWLLECLMDDPLRNDTSFMESGRLYVLHGTINQQEWRVAELLERLLKILIPVLDHPFEIVRTRIASALTNVFQPDLPISSGNYIGPKVSDFMDAIFPRLEILYSLSPVADHQTSQKINSANNGIKDLQVTEKSNGIVQLDDETSSALRLFKTINLWVVGSLTRCNVGVRPEYYKMYPLVCLLESYGQDQEVVTLCAATLAALAAAPILEPNVPHFLNAVHRVATSGSWWARSSNLNFLQVAIFHNMAVLRSRPEWADNATRIVLAALDDGRIEVREKAAEVLAGLIHCDFFEDTNTVLKKFKSRLGRRGKKDWSPALVIERHSAILGLCAFVNSSPYGVSDYVPPIFEILGDHLNDPEPIPATIRKTLCSFKRTHHDDWSIHKLKFSELQLDVLHDQAVPPSYCA